MGARGKVAMEGAGMCDGQLVHVASRSYSLACNWKVFVDNYLVREKHWSDPIARCSNARVDDPWCL